METLVNNYLETAKSLYKAYEARRTAVIAIINKIQDELGVTRIVFSDETTYPSFFDTCTELYDTPTAVRVVDGGLQATTSTKIDDEDIWFVPENYGKLDYESLVECVMNYYNSENPE